MSDAPQSPRFWVIIPAAGVGARMDADRPKQYLTLRGKTLIEHVIDRFCALPQVEHIYVGLSKADPYWPALPCSRNSKITAFDGGAERYQTVLNGLGKMAAESQSDDWVLVHDAARPCIGLDSIQDLISRLQGNPIGGLLAHPVSETLKYADPELGVATTVDRENLWAAQTPQMFRYQLLKTALMQAVEANIHVTDESSAVEALGYNPLLVEAPATNIKVTRASDMILVEKLMHDAMPGVKSDLDEPTDLKPEPKPMLRIGNGYDVHAFERGDYITLGGERIAHSQGLKAHSDGDVLLHAICDALLGALSLGDIGHHFPDTDEEWKGADSRVLLRSVYGLVIKEGYSLANLDTTIVAQAPKMAPHIEAMKLNIAEDLGVKTSQISCKATTSEKLGFTGRKEGIAVTAACLLERV